MNTQERLVHLLKNSCKVASKTYWSTKYPFPFTSPKNIKNQRFSNVFSGYKKGKLVQNGLKSDYWDMEALSINGNSPTRKLHCVLRISTYSVQMWEYKDEKKLRIWTLFTQCQFFLNKVWRTFFFWKKDIHVSSRILNKSPVTQPVEFNHPEMWAGTPTTVLGILCTNRGFLLERVLRGISIYP